jgi:Nif-specific regulatory protein
VRGVSEEAESILCNYDWPGNVRQLQHVIEQAVVLSSEDVLRKEDLPEEVFESAPQTYDAGVYRAQREIVRNAVARAKGDYKQAAVLLGRHPRSMHRFLRAWV